MAPGADALEHAGLLELAEAQDQRRVTGYTADARDPDDRVIYNGSEIRAIDLPPNTFYQPRSPRSR